MIALLLIPLVLGFLFQNVADGQLEDEAERIADQNGLADFNEDAISIYDGVEVEAGSNDPDRLSGSAGPDALFSLGQMDFVRGFGGNDVVEAGSNNDTVLGGLGDDTLGGGTGFDRLVGESGDDLLIGNNGDDLLLGRAGNDTLIGGGDKDSLNGGAGDDLLISAFARFGPSGIEEDISATAARAIDVFGPGSAYDLVDFATMQANGAFNGTDIRFLTEGNNPTQGGDVFGGAGDDTMILTGGDQASGGSGADRFVLNDGMITENTVFINDFDAAEDAIAIEYSTSPPPLLEVLDRDADAVILLNQTIVARVTGGAGLTSDQVLLIART